MKKILLMFLLISIITFAEGEKMFGFKFKSINKPEKIITKNNGIIELNVNMISKSKTSSNGIGVFNIKTTNIPKSQVSKIKNGLFETIAVPDIEKGDELINFHKNYVVIKNHSQNIFYIKELNDTIIFIKFSTENEYDNIIHYLKYNNKSELIKMMTLAKVDLDRYKMNDNFDKANDNLEKLNKYIN